MRDSKRDTDVQNSLLNFVGEGEDEMVGWHHLFNGYGLGYTLAVGDGQ